MKTKVIAVFGLMVIALLAQGANKRFLKDSVLSELNQGDIASFKQTVLETLQNVPDREVVQWQGESGARGKVMAQYSYQSEDNRCRRVRLALKGEGAQSETYKFDICQHNNVWNISATPASGLTQKDWNLFNEELNYALEEGADHHPVSWINRSTGASGVIVPAAANSSDGKLCRTAAITVFDSSGHSSDGVYRFCQLESGGWEFQSTE